jgi:PAS domain S-box-containing protein/putative nucleotidyltransferase with HDIG domain
MKVMIVEDSADSRNLLVKQLRAYHHEVMVAVDGEEALKQALKDLPDIMVSDIQMPNMDGYQLCYECKHNDRLKDIPFVFYTATYTSTEDEQFALSLGVNAFIRKPTDPETMIKILSEIFEKVRSGLLSTQGNEPLGPTFYLAEHNKRLVDKLDKKIRDLQKEVTERQRAEEALKRRMEALAGLEKRYGTIFESAAEGILVADIETKQFLHANPAITRMLGYSQEELWEMGIKDIIPQDSLEYVIAVFEAQAKGEKILAEGLPCLRKDGAIRNFDVVSARALIDGRLCNVVFFTDVTERKKAAQDLQRSEENFRRSLEDSPLGVRIITAENETLYANRAVMDIYGYDSLDDFRTIPTEKRHTPESYIIHQRMKEKMLGTHAPYNYRIDIVRKDGAIRHLELFYKEVLWDGRTQIQVLYHDVTERVQAEQALGESYEKLRRTLDAVIQTIALTVEMRDPYTAGHQRRVASLACAIAGELGLPSEQIAGIRVAGIIHDIGKTCVPSEILSKPGRLSEIEFDMIKMHSQVGHDILKLIEFPWPVAQTVLQHHERMDGSGYPGKLPGKDIILEARIIAVADVVEAMGSHRPYRPSLGIDRALAEIAQKKGILYDTAVVDACQRLFKEKAFKLEG